MTRAEAIEYIENCKEDDGPESYEDAVELFRAIFDREPDAEDGDQGDLFGHCCSAAKGWARGLRKIKQANDDGKVVLVSWEDPATGEENSGRVMSAGDDGMLLVAWGSGARTPVHYGDVDVELS